MNTQQRLRARGLHIIPATLPHEESGPWGTRLMVDASQAGLKPGEWPQTVLLRSEEGDEGFLLEDSTWGPNGVHLYHATYLSQRDRMHRSLDILND